MVIYNIQISYPVPESTILTSGCKFQAVVVPPWTLFKWRETRTLDESVTGPVSDPVLSDNQAAEMTNDIVDVLQKSTATVSKIYSVLFSRSKAEFMQDLSENNNAAELRYVRDMMFVIMKRHKPST